MAWRPGDLLRRWFVGTVKSSVPDALQSVQTDQTSLGNYSGATGGMGLPTYAVWGPDLDPGIDVHGLAGDILVVWPSGYLEGRRPTFGVEIQDYARLSAAPELGRSVRSAVMEAFSTAMRPGPEQLASYAGVGAGVGGYMLAYTQPWYVTLGIGAAAFGFAGSIRRSRQAAGKDTPILDAAMFGFGIGISAGGLAANYTPSTAPDPSGWMPGDVYQPNPHQIFSGPYPRAQDLPWWRYIWP